jgi:hypothetical protein
MIQSFTARRVLFVAALLLPLLSGPAASQAPRGSSRPRPKLEPIAETKLLMEGLLQANMRGLERILRQQPSDDSAWIFARGQSLIIAETGNLLLLRPPRTSGQDAWIDLAAELRSKATNLARSAAAKDLERSRTGLAELAVSCNRCHQAFGQQTRIAPFGEATP